MVCEAQAQPLPLTLVSCCGTCPGCPGIASLYFALNLDRGAPSLLLEMKRIVDEKKPVDLYYYRDIDGKEIDLLIVKGNSLYPIEVKKGKQPAHADKNFSVLGKLKQTIEPGLIMCLSDALVPYNRDSWYCPAAVL